MLSATNAKSDPPWRGQFFIYPAGSHSNNAAQYCTGNPGNCSHMSDMNKVKVLYSLFIYRNIHLSYISLLSDMNEVKVLYLLSI